MEVYGALCRCSLRSGAAALVGDGPAGLTARQILRVMGVGRVILCDTSPARLSKAKSLVLADEFVDGTSHDLAEVVERETGGMGVEFAG